MSLKPLGRFDEDGEEVVGWVWRKKFYPAAEAKMKSGNVYFAVSDDYQNGTRGKWMAWRAPLEVDEAIGEPLFPAGSQPLTDSEERAVQKAYEKRNPWLFRNV